MLLCCGEALIDMIPTPTESGQEGYVPHVGGAVFNTAIALGRLGVQTGMLTGLSSDLFGQQLTASLHANHVDTSLVVTSDRPTTLAFVQLTDGHASYTFYDENSAGRMLDRADLPPLPDEVSALYFGGISLVFEPGAEAYAALLKREAAARVVMLDPNIRPSFIRDIRRYRDRLDQMIALSDIVKVSDEDLNWIYPGPQSLFEKLDFVRQAGPSVVILTRSGSGATAFLKDGTEVSVPVRPRRCRRHDRCGRYVQCGRSGQARGARAAHQGFPGCDRSGPDARGPALRHPGGWRHRLPRWREPAMAPRALKVIFT